MSINQRDTQFAGFAKLLFDDLSAIALQGLKEDWNNIDIDRKQTEAIAQRAHDLAKHTLSLVPQLLDVAGQAQSVDDAIGYVPDLTKWPD